MNKNIIEELDKNGYILFKSGLDKNQILSYRNIILKNYSNGETGELYLDYAIENNQIFELFTLPNIIDKIKTISDEIFYLPDLNIQINKINISGRNKGWHIDANFESYLNLQYLHSNNYKFYKVGIFFQDSSLEYGGGIDIKIKGHKSFRNMKKATLNNLYKKVHNFFTNLLPNKKTLKVCSGDVIIFDSRLPHASSKSIVETSKINKENMKIVFYWDIAGRKIDAENYINSVIARNYFVNKNKEFNLNLLRFNYPNSFKIEQINSLKKSGITFFTLNKKDSDFFDQKYQDLKK